MEWNKRNTILFPWLSFAAGVAAGMMGVGAGVVLGPLLLELGMRPETGAATTAFMIVRCIPSLHSTHTAIHA